MIAEGDAGRLPPDGARGHASPRRSLAAALLGFFMITLDALVVSVALPSIRGAFASNITGLQWVMDGYTLPFAALLLLAGTLADRLGARQAFGAGLPTEPRPRPEARGQTSRDGRPVGALHSC